MLLTKEISFLGNSSEDDENYDNVPFFAFDVRTKTTKQLLRMPYVDYPPVFNIHNDVIEAESTGKQANINWRFVECFSFKKSI
jgi:hypothetical protein